MALTLSISVRWHNGRYHGSGHWPPSPARLFQALVAGAARGGVVAPHEQVLRWFEALPAPTIRAPKSKVGQSITSYVPNNDLDSVGGDPRRVAEVRVAKEIRPYIFDEAQPVQYLWSCEDQDREKADAVCVIADQLYQLGRGGDMAWANASVRTRGDESALLATDSLTTMIPTEGDAEGGIVMDAPTTSSLASLLERFIGFRARFRIEMKGRSPQTIFSQPPRPLFRQVAYNATEARQCFDLRETVNNSEFGRWPLRQSYSLISRIRDLTITKLNAALDGQSDTVEAVLRGRDLNEEQRAARVKIIPLPSIGHEHVDRAIRRIMVCVPSACPISAKDIFWAFSGLAIEERIDGDTGEILRDLRLVSSTGDAMPIHYGVGGSEPETVWQTVTPVVLPEAAGRRRIDPRHIDKEAKGGRERAQEEAVARTALSNSLRQSGVSSSALRIDVQREPFDAKGERAERFAEGSRFAKERFWHVRIEFCKPQIGPLVVGDGRFAGLGLFAPLRFWQEVFAFSLKDRKTDFSQANLASSLRAAVMSRVQSELGKGEHLPSFFSGHAPNGEPNVGHAHLIYAFDESRRLLLVVSPRFRIGERSDFRAYLPKLRSALRGLSEIPAGSLGRTTVVPKSISLEIDPLFASTTRWTSVTPYQCTRHPKHTEFERALEEDVRLELGRQSLPDAAIKILQVLRGRRGGLSGKIDLTFSKPVDGLVALGRTRHNGGGLFRGQPRC